MKKRTLRGIVMELLLWANKDTLLEDKIKWGEAEILALMKKVIDKRIEMYEKARPSIYAGKPLTEKPEVSTAEPDKEGQSQEYMKGCIKPAKVCYAPMKVVEKCEGKPPCDKFMLVQRNKKWVCDNCGKEPKPKNPAKVTEVIALEIKKIISESLRPREDEHKPLTKYDILQIIEAIDRHNEVL